MLPTAAIDLFTLLAGSARPALSLYLEVDPGGVIVTSHSVCERVPIAANLRHGELDHAYCLTPSPSCGVGTVVIRATPPVWAR